MCASLISKHFLALTLWQRYNSIYWQVQICNILAVIVCIIPLTTLSVGGRYTAMMLMPSATGKLAFLSHC